MEERRGVFSLLRGAVIKARSSLHSKRSVITSLWIHSGFYIPTHGETAPCSPFKRYQRLLRGKKHVAHRCCSAAVSHWQHSNARIIHSRVLSREHRAEIEFRRGIAAINNNYTHSRRYIRQNISHLHVLLSLETHSRALNFCVHRSR